MIPQSKLISYDNLHFSVSAPNLRNDHPESISLTFLRMISKSSLSVLVLMNYDSDMFSFKLSDHLKRTI